MILKKYILILISLLGAGVLQAQYMDTVCTGDAGIIYGVERGEPDSYIQWFIEGGTIIADYQDSILVDWGNTGGDFVIKLVEISMAGCHSDTVYGDVQILPPPDVGLSDAAICEGDIYEIDAGSGFTSYLWNDGNTDRRYYATSSGRYRVQVTDDNECANADSMLLTVHSLPVVSLGSDTILCNTEGLILDAQNEGAFYTWSDGSNMQTITVFPGAEEYSVEIVDLYGCISTDTIRILACGDENEYNITIPTVITPNNDSYNDTWRIVGLDQYPGTTVSVYTRWGNKVLETKGYNESWDGKFDGVDLPTDTYYYVIDLNNGSKPLVGGITIIR